MRKLLFLLILLACQRPDFQATISTHETVTRQQIDATGMQAASITASWRFPVKAQDKGAETIDYVSNAVTSTLTMRYEETQNSADFTQPDRITSETFTQKATATTVSGHQEYNQTTSIAKRPLDILLVVDTSGSMDEERDALGSNLSSLFTHVRETDWRIAVTTTNPKLCLRTGWIIPKPDTDEKLQDAKDKFNDIVTQQIKNHKNNNEHPILMAVNALGGDLTSKAYDDTNCRGRQTSTNTDTYSAPASPWVRSDSHVVVIIITDEPDDQCYFFDCDTVPTELSKQLKKIGRVANVRYQIHGILSEQSTYYYSDIITNSGGTSAVGNNLPQGDDNDNPSRTSEEAYIDVLAAISTSTQKLLNKTRNISNLVDSITDFVLTGVEIVAADGTSTTAQYTYADKTITFQDGHVPGQNDRVKVNYTYTTDTFGKEFDLSHSPLSNSVKVVPISGCATWIDKSFNDRGKTVTFTEDTKPPDGCKFTLKYKRADITLKTSHYLTVSSGAEIVASSVKLKHNGNVVSSNFNASTRKLTFTPAADDDGKRFIISYTTRRKILRYPLTPVAKAIIASISCSPISCQYNNGKVTFADNDFRAGQKIKVKQPLPSTAKVTSFTLAEGYVPDTLSLSITADGSSSTCDALDIQDNEIKLGTAAAKSNCSALSSNNLQKVTLKAYKYLDEKQFKISGTNFFTYHQHKSESWKVYLSDQEQATSAYTVDKQTHTVSFKEQPPAGSEVKIEVTLNL